MVQFLSINFFLGFLQFLLGFSKVPFFCVLPVSTPTCFDTDVPSSDSHYNKGVQANMPVCVLLLFVGMTEILKC